jgi:hypothetical protein
MRSVCPKSLLLGRFVVALICNMFFKHLKLCNKFYMYCGTLILYFLFTMEMCVSWMVLCVGSVMYSFVCVCVCTTFHAAGWMCDCLRLFI